MTLVKWSPYRKWNLLNRELERLFDDFGFSTGRIPTEEGGESAWYPAVDIAEDKDNYSLRAELPGVKKDDVKITLSEDVVTVAGEKKYEQDVKEGGVHRSERAYGAFTRSFRLPGPIDGNNVKAEYRDGVLTLTIPKSEAAKPKEIQIK